MQIALNAVNCITSIRSSYPYITFNFTNGSERPVSTIEHNIVNRQIMKPCPLHPIRRIYMFCTQTVIVTDSATTMSPKGTSKNPAEFCQITKKNPFTRCMWEFKSCFSNITKVLVILFSHCVNHVWHMQPVCTNIIRKLVNCTIYCSVSGIEEPFCTDSVTKLVWLGHNCEKFQDLTPISGQRPGLITLWF